MIKYRYLAGKFIEKMGWDLRPTWKVPQCSVDIVGIGMSLIRAKKQGGKINVIQIGAFDGITSDPLRQFLTDPDIHAVLLEPQETPFKKLDSLYKESPNIRPIRAALAEHDGFIYMSTSCRDGSAMASTIEGHSKRFGIQNNAITRVEVPCMTVSSLMRSVGWSHIDFLQVDVEGADWKVVKEFLLLPLKPRIINFEILHLSKEIRSESIKVLSGLGYQIIDRHFDRAAFHQDLIKP